MTRAMTSSLLAACVLLMACTEKPQTLGSRKSDLAPSTGTAGTHTARGWKAGDAVGWETQLKARAQAQNEYSRLSAP